MSQNWQIISGVVQQGHGIASGQSVDSPYPGGSIALQVPCFQALGLDLSHCWCGTLNLSIAPLQFVMQAPAYTFRQVAWTAAHPPEDFSFSACQVMVRAQTYDGFVYYPHPETKLRHFQDPSTLEILAVPISGVQYGDRLEVALNPAEIQIVHPGN